MKVIKSESLSSRWESRFICIDEETGEILDDAQGYGYKTPQKAYSAFAYKSRTKEQKKDDARKKSIVVKYLTSHNGKTVMSDLEDMYLYGYKDGLSDKEINKEVNKYLDKIDFDFKGNEITKQFFIKQTKKLM